MRSQIRNGEVRFDMLELPTTMSGIADNRKTAVQEELRRVISSVTFSGSERHRRFLSFVVEQALKGDTEKLNEFVLGFEVFRKSESFDPRIDSIVRVEARRLRERLKKYYDEEGRDDPLIITLRPRSFVPEFTDAAGATSALRDRLRAHRGAILIAAAVLLGAGLAAAVFSLRRQPRPPQTAAILVVPFQTLSPPSGQELLGDAVADAIITGLAGSPGLRVISRGSGREVKESGRSPAELAADLQVDYLVEGAVRVDGTAAHISAKMTDVHSQSYVWAATREEKLEALPDLERQFTTAILANIRVPLPPRSEHRRSNPRPSNWDAYSAFLKGQYYLFQQERDSTERAITLFETATRIDPNYAPAWAWLSQAYYLTAMRTGGRDSTVIEKGKQAAQKALSLDGNLGEAHAAVATYAALTWDWKTADSEFRRALELSPDWAQGHLLYAMLYLVPTGRSKAAAGEMMHARELDPLTRMTRSMMAEVFYFNRDYARAITESEDLRRPGALPLPDDRSYLLSLALSGQRRRALEELEKSAAGSDDHPPNLALRGYLLAVNGQKERAMALRDRLLQEPSGVAAFTALVDAGLGDRDDAFRQLSAAIRVRSVGVAQALADPAFDSLRSDPRYEDLLRQIGLKSGT